MTITAPAVTEPKTAARNGSYAAAAGQTTIAAAAAGLRARGHHVQRVPDAAAALRAASDLLPHGAEVFTASSVTAQTIGLSREIDESGRYRATARPDRDGPRQPEGPAAPPGRRPQWVTGSHRVLTLRGDPEPGRTHILLVDQPLGF